MNQPQGVIAIFGNPASGKSTLLNAILQQLKFRSGVSIGRGMTTTLQECFFEGHLFLDTPGLADPFQRQQAAEAIESALKKTNNYKIIFVATLESGRLKLQDVETINCVCESIKSEFTYGIIINKVTKNVEHQLKQGTNLDTCFSLLKKRPSNHLLFPKFEMLEDENDVLLTDNDARNSLMQFIQNLQANMIHEKDVEHIDIRDYDSKVLELEKKWTQMLEHERQQKEEAKRQWEQAICSVVEEFKTEEGAAIERCVGTHRKTAWHKFGYRDTVWTDYQTVVKVTTFRRTKTTRNNGAIDYSPWQLFRSDEKVIGSRQTAHHE